MPKQTFYKLPQEKQERILAAAKREFTQVRYSDASINQIIRDAGIPRGSFYQYFEDKKDLFLCFLQDYRAEILRGFSRVVKEMDGDFLGALIAFLDDMIEESYREPGSGFRIILSEPWIFECIWADMLERDCTDSDVQKAKEESTTQIKWSRLDLEDEAEIDVFIHILGAVIHDSLCDIFIGHEYTLEEAKQLIHGRLGSLRRHYEKKSGKSL